MNQLNHPSLHMLFQTLKNTKIAYLSSLPKGITGIWEPVSKLANSNLHRNEAGAAESTYLISHSPFPRAQRFVVIINVPYVKTSIRWDFLHFLEYWVNPYKCVIITLHYMFSRHRLNLFWRAKMKYNYHRSIYNCKFSSSSKF